MIGGDEKSWLVDLTSGKGSITEVSGDEKADCTLTIKDTDFVNLVLGKLNPQKAFMTGKLKLKGNMLLAQKLPVVFGDAKKAKL
jgi:putative sterol carrier protein